MIPVTLQINLAPTDLPTAVHTVPHQLRQWGSQVDEVLFVVDLHRSRGKFAEGWEERLPGLRALIEECLTAHPHGRSVDVDYSEQARGSVERYFFSGASIPAKDYRGAPFFAYFFALLEASHDVVLHFDSDMLFGGGSPTWIDEALHLLAEHPEVLACNPLPGPPTDDGTLRSQSLPPEPMASPAFRSPALSTRLFLLDRRRIRGLAPERAGAKESFGARVDGNPPYLPAEVVISREMARSDLARVDFLGTSPGMWSVHPPYRSATFYARLPSLVAEIERGDIPDGQLGRHEVEDCLVDWTDVRPTPRRRLEKHSRLLLQRLQG